MRAWHFVGAKLRDGRPIPADGEWLKHTGKVQICESGLHASLEPFDALKYAPGNTLCLVECEDIVDSQIDKLVCRRRKIVARIDATELLREFARAQALSVAHLWPMPDVVRRYLETGDESIRAAARAAADASYAARAAARAAADASYAAADAAARAAADAAARAAADAAYAVARADFNRRVNDAFRTYI